MRTILSILLLLAYLSIIVLTSCQSGLNPELQKDSKVRGKLIFISSRDTFPPTDSIKDMRVVGFKTYPPTNVVADVLTGNAYFTDRTLDYSKDTVDFEITIPVPPVELQYIVAGYQYGSILEWRVIGVYHKGTDSITSLKTEKGKNYEIEIFVDWKNLPPQPF
jgi:hypothetical protein